MKIKVTRAEDGHPIEIEHEDLGLCGGGKFYRSVWKIGEKSHWVDVDRSVCEGPYGVDRRNRENVLALESLGYVNLELPR